MESCNQRQDTPKLCSNNCGFFGSSATNNLCSKCYRDFLAKEKLANYTKLMISVEKPLNVNPNPRVLESIVEDDTDSIVKTKNRCESCKRRVGLTGFECRCGGMFCATHRHPEEHSCNFDFKTAGRVILQKENPLIKGDKLSERI